MQFKYLFQKLLRNIAKVRLRAVFAVALLHGVLSYWFMSLAGEEALTSNGIAFFYFWVVTSSTVGYGDASPVTDTGMLISALFMIPISLGLFGVLLTKISTEIVTFFRKEVTGMKRFENSQDHILMMGYHPQRTREMINLILADKCRSGREVLVVTDEDIEHPFLEVDGVEFCRVESMTHDDTFARIGLKNAAKVVVDSGEDAESYVLSTLCAARNTKADIVTYIVDANISTSLHAQYDNIEVIQDNSEEMIVRAVQDPGSSQTINQLMRSDKGQTIYVTEFTPDKNVNIDAVSAALRLQHGALMLGIAKDRRGAKLELNVQDRELSAGETWFLHYMHDKRLPKGSIAL